MRVIIMTDSLGLPRNKPENVDYEDSYIDRLRDKYKDIKFITFSMGGATLSVINQQYINYFQPINPDLVILHVGIVDCAPRALKGWESTVINSNPLTQKLYNLLFKKHTAAIRKMRKLTYTPLHQFESMARGLNRLLPSKLLWIGIIPATDSYEAHLPGIGNNINAYNGKLKSIFSGQFLDMSQFPENGIMTDHHHINVLGHEYIFNRISEYIDEVKRTDSLDDERVFNI